MDPSPGRAVTPPGRRPGDGAGRVMPPEGSDGRLIPPKLGREMPLGRCMPGRAMPPGNWGLACGNWGLAIWGLAIGICGLACGIWGRAIGICGLDWGIDGLACGIDGRAMPPAGRAMPPDGRAMAGRPPPPPGRASARAAQRHWASSAIDNAESTESRITFLAEGLGRAWRADITSRLPAGAACG